MKPDVGAVTFCALDVMGHRFWQQEDVMRRTALGMDRALGEILAALGPDDHVLVVSDHGFQAIESPSRRWGFDARWLLEQGQTEDGVMVVSEWVTVTLKIDPGPEARREATLARLKDLFESVQASDRSPAFDLDVIHVPERPSEARERPRMLVRTMQRLQPAYAFPLVASPVPEALERIGGEDGADRGPALPGRALRNCPRLHGRAQNRLGSSWPRARRSATVRREPGSPSWISLP